MDQSVFRFIWRYSRRDQAAIVALVLLSLPFYFLSLDLPRTIVNRAIQGEGFEQAATQRAFELRIPPGWWGDGVTVFDGVELDRVSFLVWMSLAFLALVVVNGMFKLVINTAKGRLGERMLRRLRFMLFDRILRFPFPYFRKLKAPELATMVKDEVEPLGGFIGDAYVQPVFLGGQIATALTFIVLQNFWLGILAGTVALIQAMLIPRLRRPILVLGRERQLTARDLAGRIGEAVDGIEQIHVNDTGRFERAEMGDRLGRIFAIRFRLYQKKFNVKFINNLLSQLTPFLFYLVGGYLAILGRLDVGQLIAVIVAYKDLPGPMKELIDWDQRRQDTQIKYEQVIAQFDPEGLTDPALLEPVEAPIEGPLILSNVTIAEGGGAPMVDHVSVTMQFDESVALMGPGASRAIEAVARLRTPASGEIRFGDRSLSSLPNAVFGRNVAYLGQSIYLRGPTVFDTLSYALKRYPREDGSRSPHLLREARRSGNPIDSPLADWIDYAGAGVEDIDGLRVAMLEAMAIVEMEDDLYSWGLREPVPEGSATGESILRAREAVAARLRTDKLEALVEPFDPDRFNENATIAENLIFGVTSDPALAPEAIARHPDVEAVLREADLYDPLVAIGESIATTMLAILADIESDNPLLEQFSFVGTDDLPQLERILGRATRTGGDRRDLMQLAFGYVEVRHRLGVLDSDLRARIVEARALFRRRIEASGETGIAFYRPDRHTPGARLIDDILFGRIANDVARARDRVEALVFGALDAERLLPLVLVAGLDHEIGIGGRRLTAAQRQQVGLARAMLRKPKILLLNEPMIVVDEKLGERILARVVGLRRGLATYAALGRPQYASHFERRIWFEDGRLLSDERDGVEQTSRGKEIDLDMEVAALGQVPLFANLQPGRLKFIALSSDRVAFDAGEDLFRQGDRADCAYVLISGKADVMLDGAEGTLTIATLGRNEFVGELAMLTGQPRTATVRATRRVVALVLSRDLFFRVIEGSPQISVQLMRDLGRRLARATEQIAEVRAIPKENSDA